MRRVEHAVDIWDLTGMHQRLDSRMLHEHLCDFQGEGWEPVCIEPNVDLADHAGPCHLLVFKRVTESPS